MSAELSPRARSDTLPARLTGCEHTPVTPVEAASRLEHYGPNTLARHQARDLIAVFLRQFLSPLIYMILVIAAGVSLLLEEWSDAVFIAPVLLINAILARSPHMDLKTLAMDSP